MKQIPDEATDQRRGPPTPEDRLSGGAGGPRRYSGLTSSVAARFNAAAHSYDEHAGVQIEGAHALMSLFDSGCTPQSILEIGCGTGVLTQLLVERFPVASITALDIALDMVKHASRRLAEQRPIHWHVGELSTLASLESFDCVTSHAALHWMRPLNRTFSEVARRLAPSGSFVFGLMLDGTLGELHATRRRVLPGLPVMSALPTKEDVLSALDETGFRVNTFARKTIRIMHNDAWQMIRDIHAQGLTGGDVSHGRRLLTRRELMAIAQDYDRTFKTPDGVPATYEIGLVMAEQTPIQSAGLQTEVL